MAEWIGVVLGLIGTVLGGVDLLLIMQDRRQRIAIDRLPGEQIQFRVTNHSTRPIPLSSARLFYKVPDGSSYKDGVANVKLSGMTVPGVLDPESSLVVQWSTDTLLDAIMASSFYVEVATQRGKTIRTKEFSQ